MTPPALALLTACFAAAAVVVVAASWPWRPRPRLEARGTGPGVAGGGTLPRSSRMGPAPGSFAAGGGRGPTGDRNAASPALARAIGLAAVGAIGLAFGTVPALAAAGLALSGPGLRERRAARRRAARIAEQLPEVVDLLALAVGAGLTVGHAVRVVARTVPGDLASELGRVMAEVDRGRRLADALDGLPARAGEAARPLVATLNACERYGAPVADALERLAVDARERHRRGAEQAARRLPVLLLFPLVLCILPAFALLAVAPLIADAVQALRP